MIRLLKHVYRTLFEVRVDPTPWLRHNLHRDWSGEALDPGVELFMHCGAANNPIDAQRMIDKYGDGDPVVALSRLPPRPMMNMTARLRWLRLWLLGGYYGNPHQWEFDAYMDGTLFNPYQRARQWQGRMANEKAVESWKELPVMQRTSKRRYNRAHRYRR